MNIAKRYIVYGNTDWQALIERDAALDAMHVRTFRLNGACERQTEWLNARSFRGERVSESRDAE